jgi:hypothetical protein
MRRSALILVAAIGVALSAAAASAAPLAPVQRTGQTSGVVEIAGHCGWGLHSNRSGHCVPNRYGYYRPRPYWQPYPYPYPYAYAPGNYGDGYEPWNRPSPTDRVANQLNRQQMMYGY